MTLEQMRKLLARLNLRSLHWRRLVTNIGWANRKIGGGQKVVKNEKCMGVFQLLGKPARAAPQILSLWFSSKRSQKSIQTMKVLVKTTQKYCLKASPMSP